MKRLFLCAGAAALMTAVPVLPASVAQAEHGIVDICRTVILPDVPEANLGECVSFSKTLIRSPEGFVAHDCDAFMEIAPEAFFELFDSYADCVRELRD